MLHKEQVKKEIERLMINFPSYNPVLDGEINVVTELMDKLKNASDEDLRKAMYNLTVIPGNKFAPSTSEIIHAVNELKYEGMSDTDRMLFDNGYKSPSEILEELGIGKPITEEQKIKNHEAWDKAKREAKERKDKEERDGKQESE